MHSRNVTPMPSYVRRTYASCTNDRKRYIPCSPSRHLAILPATPDNPAPSVDQRLSFYLTSLEVLLAPYKIEAWLAVHVAFDVQLAPQHLGPAEEHPCLGRRVDLADRLEHRIPVGPPEVGRRPEPCDGVLIRLRVIDHDVGSVVGLNLGREILRCAQSVLSPRKP